METKLDKLFDFESLYEGWIKMGERYEKLKEEIDRRVKELDDKLTEEQKNELQSICLLYNQREYEAKKAVYKGGFKTGLGLAIEAIADEYKGEE